MAKKYFATPKAERVSSSKAKLENSSFNHNREIIPIVFIILYLLVDFIPEWGALDVAGPQWIYLTVINIVSTGYILYFSEQHGYTQSLKNIFNTTLSQVYLFLFILAGVSILFAINRTEALVCYSGFINTIITFFNLSILLSHRVSSIKTIAQIISIIVFIQSITILKTFFEGINNTPLDDVIYNLKGNTGNKNTLATSLIVKLSFVIYCVYNLKSWSKFIHIPVLILGIISIFILNTRSAYLGLFLQIGLLLTFCISQFFKKGKAKEILSRISPILLALIFAFFIAQAVLLNAGRLQAQQTATNSITERIGSIASTTHKSNVRRFQLWNLGIDYIKKNPLMGTGYGNCKLAMIPYENKFQTDFNYGKHLHNDFIETAMELGIIGSLAFIAVFVCALVYILQIWKSKIDDQIKYIAIFSGIALTGYFIDAVFNFPSERPIMQLLFAIILAINSSAFITYKHTVPKPKTTHSIIVFSLISLFGLGIALYYKYFTYKSLVVQSIIAQDDFPNSGSHSWKEINDLLPNTPNLASLANSPISVIKAWYLSQDGKYDEALVLLNKSTNVNPYNMTNEYVKAQIFHKTNKLDSAFFYAKKGFYTRPSNIGFYGLLTDISKAKKDTLAIKKAFKECIKRRPEVANVWNKYIEALLSLNYNKDSLLVISSLAEKSFPTNKSILKNKYVINATLASNNGYVQTVLENSLKIIELDPLDYSYIENVGACYFMLKKYELAIPYLDKIIKTNTFSNGKSEYIKALCLINLGKKEEACYYLKLANSKKFLGAQNIISTHCK